jgi:hypothetical protein
MQRRTFLGTALAAPGPKNTRFAADSDGMSQYRLLVSQRAQQSLSVLALVRVLTLCPAIDPGPQMSEKLHAFILAIDFAWYAGDDRTLQIVVEQFIPTNKRCMEQCIDITPNVTIYTRFFLA